MIKIGKHYYPELELTETNRLIDKIYTDRSFSFRRFEGQNKTLGKLAKVLKLVRDAGIRPKKVSKAAWIRILMREYNWSYWYASTWANIFPILYIYFR